MQKQILSHNIPIERFLEEISQIPRVSFHEEKISAYLVDFAKEHHFWHQQDQYGNVIIKKNGSAGREYGKPVILQAHIDMVGAKKPESSHDFLNDPIELVLEGNILRAKDTSLGADDGYGIAYILALLDAKDISHPPLECVFTVAEEVNMNGANSVDVSCLEGKRLISLDGEGESETYVSSVFSNRFTFHHQFGRYPVNAPAFRLTVDGITGRSFYGVVNGECCNAIKLAARILKRFAYEGHDICLISYVGGEQDNRMPLRCDVEFYGKDLDLLELQAEVKEEIAFAKEEFNNPDFDANAHIDNIESSQPALSAADSAKLMNLIYLMPNNSVKLTARGEDLVNIINVGIVKLDEEFELVLSSRSRVPSAEHQLYIQCLTLAESAGVAVEMEKRYASWPINKDSELLPLAHAIYEADTGKRLNEVVAPGGMEMGIFYERMGGLDIYEVGINVFNPHCTDEYMEMDSFHVGYDRLVRLLAMLKD